MRLSDLKTGERGIIVKVSGHGSFRKRITEMGFIKGKEVRVVLNAPLKDPIEYEIIGYKISLRREEAEEIEVISESEARAQEAAETAKAAVSGNADTSDAGHAAMHDAVAESDAGSGNLSRNETGCGDAEALDRKMRELAEERRHIVRVALVGNPNCGKTSLFNVASGSHEHVGNYSGVTVDAKEGHFEYKGYQFVLVDLPGTYSLSAYSPEELYVRKNLIDNIPDVVINVVDASNLERNLYLTAQIIDMNLRVVMALNMYDELESKGDRLDTVTLGHLLGMPVIPTVSRSGKGIDRLFDTVIHVYENNDPTVARHIHINHGQELETSIDRIQHLIWKNEDIRTHYSTRWLAIKYLENDSDVEKTVEALPNHDEIIAARFEENKRIESLLGGTNAESAIVDAKYAFVQGALKETYTPAEVRKKHTITDKIDAVVTNRWAAFPIFILLLYIIFEATFRLGDYPMQWIEWLVEQFGAFVATTMPEGMLKDLIVDGIIGGVGSVLVFLPNILILYLFISLLEDSGYMARAAFIMDKLMHRIGLHGKSFIPMIMGFGCNVPAIMATRTIPQKPPDNHAHHPHDVLRGPSAGVHTGGRGILSQTGLAGTARTLRTGHHHGHHLGQDHEPLHQGRQPAFRHGAAALPRPDLQVGLPPHLGKRQAVPAQDGRHHPRGIHHHLVPRVFSPPRPLFKSCRTAGELIHRQDRQSHRACSGAPRLRLENGRGHHIGSRSKGTCRQHYGCTLQR